MTNSNRPAFGLFMKILMLLLVVLCFVNRARPQDIPLKFSYLTVDNGLSHTDAKDISQDKLGYVWVATLFGLDRYDGYSVKRFYNTNVPKNNAFKNRVRSIYPDDDGNIWLATDGGIQCFDSKTEKYIDYNTRIKTIGDDSYTKILKLKNDELAVIVSGKLRFFKTNGGMLVNVSLHLPQATNFADMVVDNNGNICLASDKGMWILNSGSTYFNHLSVQDNAGKDYANITKLVIDRQNNLLIISGKQIFSTRDPLTKITNPVNRNLIIAKQFTILQGAFVADVIQDRNLNYWISTDAGLYNLNNELKLKREIESSSFVGSINTNSLDKLYIDRTNCLWVCTFGGGVNYCDLDAKLFYTFQNNPKATNTLSGNHIRSILEGDGGKVWIGTNANGLNQYNFNTKKFTWYNTYNSAIRIGSDEVNALAFDKMHNLWIGTDKGIDVLNATGTGLEGLPGHEKFPQQVTALCADAFGNVWFCASDESYGCITYNLKTNSYSVMYHGFGHYLWADPKLPELLIASTQGVKRIIINSTGAVLASYTYNADSGTNSLSSDYTWPIQKQNDSTYWIGTLGGGLDRLILKGNNTYKINTYGKQYGIFNDVETLEIDNAGNIWMGGNGLECFNPHTLKLTRYDKNDGLQGNSFKVGSSFKGKDGSLYFGGINGLNHFYPDAIKINAIPAHPIITDLVVNNQSVTIGQADSVLPSLTQVISYDKSIKLNYLQNNFVISFSAMHFANPLRCRYRYKLMGFDAGWKYTDGSNPSAAYSNLDYNNYTFIVQATNNDGIWSTSKASVYIEVTPPWWKSTLAKIIYFILLISGLTGIYIYQARWFRLKREIAIRDVEEKKREEMHLQREELYQQQLQFFTNISHEFRTPLTLILGPLENLVKEDKQSVYQHSYEIMYRNAKRLINLINELMNFRKVADSVIKLCVMPVDTESFVQDVFNEFVDLSVNNGISFTLNRFGEQYDGWLDPQITEKILFNLLNNAFKYTATGGKITLDVFFNVNDYKPAYDTEYQFLNVYRAEKYVYFRVTDTGIGISKESISQIFDRYYRISNNHLGSGVGLALVKSLTLLHKGDIFVYSERLKGTEIIIALPWEKHVYTDAEKGLEDSADSSIKLEKIDNTVIFKHGLISDEQPETYNNAAARQHILLVEDNDELRTFLKNILQQHYFVYEAVDGKQGLDMAIDKMPDLIISDVMMPVMNGVALCNAIKQQFETSHIPFIILSAKDALEARLEGLESGADYYFSKPLSIDFLLLTIYNIFEQKQKLKLRYTSDYYTEATELVHSTKDKEFIDKLIKLIDDNIQAPELDVDYLCQQLYTSRSKLYQKIKNISGQAIGDFIRTARLKKAVYFMTHEDISINELIERIGFTSTSYFSKAFKKEFGHSPTQFMQSVKKAKSSVIEN